MQHHDQQDPDTVVQGYSPFQFRLLTVLKWSAYAAVIIAMMYVMHGPQ